MPAPLVPDLIEKGLGYCCPYAFFYIYRPTRLIVERLGVSRTTVKYWKAKYHAGDLQCKCKEKCLQDRLPEARKMVLLIRRDDASSSSSRKTASSSPYPRD